jgi:predicted Zn-dependent protease
MMAGGQALAMQNQLNFSRDMEREADRIGFGVMMQAGYEPQGFVTMFEKLQQAARLNDNGAFPYLRTHPMTTERMAEMQSRQQLVGRPAAPAPDLVHAMMVGRARVLSNPGVDGLHSYVGEAEGAQMAAVPRARQTGILYAAALASSKLRQPAAASRLAGKLAVVTAGDERAARWARLLEAEVALAAGNAAPAAALNAASSGRPEVMLSSQARVNSGRAADAAQRLQTWVALHPRDAQAWQLLGAAYTAQGQTMRAIRADAESQVAHLDYQAAMDRFKAAQELARKTSAGGGDHIEASIIDTRARQVESLLREQALER